MWLDHLCCCFNRPDENIYMLYFVFGAICGYFVVRLLDLEKIY